MAPYEDTRKKSKALHQRALQVMPGGDTRSVTYFDPYPCFMESGSGCTIQDVDGNEYIDFLNNYTSLVLGHAHPAVVKAVTERIKKGSAFPAPIEEQVTLAEVITGRIKSCDLVRFCNSGSEANIQAIRAAKTYTKRDRIVKVYGGYLGGFDSKDFIDIPFNDIETAENIIKTNKDDIACVILEPVIGKGMIPAEREFLHELRELTSDYGIILVFDEVVTFRLDTGGVQNLYGIVPDMTTLGKVIGGGYPVGAFGGREDLMMLFSPQKKEFIPHSGTFNGNPVTMAAGLETLKIYDSGAVNQLNKRGDLLRKTLNSILEDMNVCISGMGSLLHFHFREEPFSRVEEFEKQDTSLFSRLHMLMMTNSIYMGPKGLFNLSLAIDTEEIDRFLNIAEQVISQIDNPY
jgi:glutamate-1-semialdehyde 2,1-aminomutase